MASNDTVTWSQVPMGGKLLLTNTGGSLGIVTATVNYVPADAPESPNQLSEGAVDGTQTYTLEEGLYTVNWLIAATTNDDGLSGAAGFSAQVMNPDGTTNGTTVTVSCTKSSGGTSNESGLLNIEVF